MLLALAYLANDAVPFGHRILRGLLPPPVIVFDETRPKVDVTVRHQLRFIEAVKP